MINVRVTLDGRSRTALAKLVSRVRPGWTKPRLRIPRMLKSSVRIGDRATTSLAYVIAQMVLRGLPVRSHSAPMLVPDTESA